MIWKLSLKFLNGLVLKCLVEVSYVILPFGTGWQAPRLLDLMIKFGNSLTGQ